MKVIYGANYSGGDWDDYFEKQIFVSQDKQVVEDWINKFNKLLKEWKEYYSQFGENIHSFCEDCRLILKEEYVENYRIVFRFYQLRDINKAFITTIKLR